MMNIMSIIYLTYIEVPNIVSVALIAFFCQVDSDRADI
jgi:hypothetical protein